MDIGSGVAGATLGLALGPVLPAVARWATNDDHARLSMAWTTPTVALLVGPLSARVGWTAALPAYVIFALVGAVLLVIDLALHRLPDRLTLPSYPVGLGLLAIPAISAGSGVDLLRAVAGAGAALGLYLVLFLVGGAGIGAGDVKYSGVLGMHLAWFGWETWILGICAGFVIGGAVGIVLLISRRATLKTRIPFGPSMIVGAVIACVGWPS